MKLRALFLGLVLALTIPGIALAALYQQPASFETQACYNLVNSSAGPNACFGETWGTGDWPTGDLFIATNGSDVSDLSNIDYGLCGQGGTDCRCDTNLLTDWNDCFTDAVVKLPAGTCFRAYVDENYGGQRVFAASNWASDPGSVTKIYHFPHLAGGLNNTISSFRLYSC
jgi:hypothetical protein